MHTMQCRDVTKAWCFGPVNQTKTDGCLTCLLTGPKRALWPHFGPVNRPVSLCLVDRTKTPRFDHSSTLQGVHIYGQIGVPIGTPFGLYLLNNNS
ncbi:hypothetical protein Hanom_Chr01g00064051 [Helianthus anomalus]